MISGDPDTRADLNYCLTHPPMKEIIAELTKSGKRKPKVKKEEAKPKVSLEASATMTEEIRKTLLSASTALKDEKDMDELSLLKEYIKAVD